MNFDINPSIVGADPLRMAEEIARVEAIGTLHLDMEDGNYSSDITFGVDTVAAICKATTAACDVHLMVMNPMEWPQRLAECGVVAVASQIEVMRSPARFLDYVRSLGMKAGLATNLKTPVEELEPFAEDMDYVLFWGNEDDRSLAFREYTVKKVAAARRILPQSVEIWADGGIGPQHLPPLVAAGLSRAVMGRAIFAAEDPHKAYQDLLASVGAGVAAHA